MPSFAFLLRRERDSNFNFRRGKQHWRIGVLGGPRLNMIAAAILICRRVANVETGEYETPPAKKRPHLAKKRRKWRKSEICWQIGFYSLQLVALSADWGSGSCKYCYQKFQRKQPLFSYKVLFSIFYTQDSRTSKFCFTILHSWFWWRTSLIIVRSYECQK